MAYERRVYNKNQFKGVITYDLRQVREGQPEIPVPVAYTEAYKPTMGDAIAKHLGIQMVA